MIKYQSNRQLSFTDFALPLNGALDENSRWVRLAYLLPWDDLLSVYARGLSDALGRPIRDLRIELDTLIIQELMDLTNREVIAQIQKNPYLQYFGGFQGFVSAYYLAMASWCDVKRFPEKRPILL